MGEYIPSAPINDEAKKNNKNLPGMGGVFNPINFHLYHYAGNNPVRYVDPDGRIVFVAIPIVIAAVKATTWFVGSLAICAAGGYVLGKTAENAVEYAKSKNDKSENNAQSVVTNGTQSTVAAPNPLKPEGDDNNDDNSEKVSYNGKSSSVYRGGSDFTVKPNEVKIDKVTGNVKTSHGVSVNVNSKAVSKFGGAYRIDNLPKGLKIIQRGNNIEHFEIVPSYEMPLNTYQELLNKIVISGPF